MMSHSQNRLFPLTLTIIFLALLSNKAEAVASPSYVVGGSCHTLGQTLLADDKTSTIGCFKPTAAQADCGTQASPTCIYKRMTAIEQETVRVSFELVGAGGGGGGGDWMSWGGAGGSGAILRFDAQLPVGSLVTLSPGSGGLGGETGLGMLQGDGGSGLMANGGHGGGTDGSNTPQVGPSGVGGGGGAASVVQGEGLFAVAGAGGGGGGGSYQHTGSAGNTSGTGGMSGMNGGSGKNGCNGRDGGGGGGGGGGYPGGAGGQYGCDSFWDGSRPGFSSAGGNLGSSYLYHTAGFLPFTKASNAAGAGLPGSPGCSGCGPAATAGSCGRVTIWSSTGVASVFNCGGASPPQWIVN